MGCKGSRPADVPTEEKAAGATLLQEPEAGSKAAKPQEPAAKDNVGDITAGKVRESPRAPADANASEAEMTVDAEEAPKPPPDAARTRPGDVNKAVLCLFYASSTAQEEQKA